MMIQHSGEWLVVSGKRIYFRPIRRGLRAFLASRATPGLAATLVVLSTWAGSAQAQSLALAPALVPYTFKPGQPFQFDLAVANKGTVPTALRVSVTDFWYNDKNEKTFTPPGTSPRSAANWIEFVPRQLTVAGGQTGKVSVMVTPPATVSGGYYAMVFVESKPELDEKLTSAEKKAVYTNMRLGAMILLTAQNTENYKVEVADAQFTPPSANQSMKIDVLLDNQSNTHIFATPKIAVLNARHELIAKSDGEAKRFLPGQKDRLAASWAGALQPGTYSAILTILYGEDKNYTQEFPFTIGTTEK